MQAADWELQAGLKGSKAVRAAALRCLNLLIQAVDSADALAFFLPGIATGLAKALVAAGSSHGARAQIGAGASSAATVAALQGLAAILRITLGSPPETEEISGLQASAEPTQGTGAAEGAGAAALEQLLQLAEQAKAAPVEGAREAAGPEAVNPPKTPLAPAGSADLRVQRTAEWVQAAGNNVHSLLAAALPHLTQYPRPAVREALAKSGCASAG